MLDENIDFNDLMLRTGPETVREQLAAARAPESSEDFENAEQAVPPPISLDVARPPDLPGEVLPGPFGQMADAVARATETPRELSTLLGLSVIACCVQGKYVIQGYSGHLEPLSIWTLCALNSGNRKSAVLLAMTTPLNEWEYEQAQAKREEIQRLTAKRKNGEARIARLRTQYAKEEKPTEREGLEQEIQRLEATLPEVPVPPRAWVEDVTAEKLGQVMAEQGERIALLSDEGGCFDNLAGRYSGGVPNLDIFLKGHTGAAVRVDRAGRGTVYLQRPALTLGLSPQPDVLRELSEHRGFRGRGLLARFLYALPRSRLGHRTLNAPPVSDAVRDAYAQGVRSLLALEAVHDANAREVPHLLRLTEPALDLWREFGHTVETQLRDGGRLEHLRDWAGKLPGAALRIAGLLHCAEHVEQSPASIKVSEATMTAALELAAVLSDHALVAFDTMGADPDIDVARRLWRWIERQQQETFTARDAFQGLKGKYRRMDELTPAFEILVERGYITEVDRDRRVGRPSRAFQVTPGAMKEWA